MVHFKLLKMKYKFDKVDKNALLIKVAAMSRSFFKQSFENQGFTDQNLNKWEDVNRRIPGTKEYELPKKKGLSRRTKPILSMTGALRRAVTGMPIIVTNDRAILRVNDSQKGAPLYYGKVHNEIGVGKRKVVRKFMGVSEVLTKNIENYIMKAIKPKIKR